MPGTGILDDYGDTPWAMPYALLKWCLAARVCGVKIGFVSVGAGPMDNAINRWLLKSAAKLANYRSYRDMVSKEFMQSIGMDTRNDPIYPDIVFKLQTPPSSTTLSGDEGSLTVGVGAMLYYGPRGLAVRGAQFYEMYLKKITRFVLWLLEHGHRVRLLMGDAIDQHAADSVFNAVMAERRSLSRKQFSVAPVRSFNDLMLAMADTHIVVASRFHNLICALKLNKPTISLGYRKRHEELMRGMGLGEFCQKLEHLDVDRLIDQFTTLTSARASYVGIIAEANGAYQKLLAQQDELLSRTLLQPE
jgi:polysaccharide pyruvyl transferase WcaK-like protein